MALKFSFKKLPVDADGNAYESLEAFQAAEIKKLLVLDGEDGPGVAKAIVEHKDDIIEILELTMESRPGARGVKKPRKAKPAAEPQLPGTEVPQ